MSEWQFAQEYRYLPSYAALAGITLYGSFGISEEITGEEDNFIEMLSIGLGWCDKIGDIVEPALRGGLKGWTTRLKDGIAHLVKDH